MNPNPIARRPALLEGWRRLIRHESRALAAHRAALDVRWRIARRMRSLGELVQHQLDLLPLTRRRLARDQRHRAALLRGLLKLLPTRRLAARGTASATPT